MLRRRHKNLVEDFKHLLHAKYPQIPFSGCRGNVQNVPVNQRPGQKSVFPVGLKNLVEDVEYLLPAKFCQIPFNRCREVEANKRPGWPSSFSDQPENTNFVDGFEFLLPAKFRQILLSGSEKLIRVVRRQ